ncbi:MAG: PAS domain-containing protein, partial [candidate division NC10 bacterium]|nr:PAS domain-containing protein [candidate division NC10 bacterium]
MDREQRIVLWNEGAQALLGFKAEEVLGKYCHEVLGCRDDSGCVVCQAGCPDMMRMLRRERVRARDLLVRTKGGRETWLSVSTIRMGP